MFDLFPLSDEEIASRKAKREAAFRRPSISSLSIGIEETNPKLKTQKIAALNDSLRSHIFSAGKNKVVMTPSVEELNFPDKIKLLNLVASFDDFSKDNNPHGERDFGKIAFQGKAYFWKIDYYDNSLKFGSDDPSDSNITTRVLTLLHTSEY
jgi:hypothetical protein